jgi:hypothetical protein
VTQPLVPLWDFFFLFFFVSVLGKLTKYSFPNVSLWITEYNYDNQDLATSQSFYNTSAEYLDRLTYVERYSYFGAFRSSQSNVGPNASMLNNNGTLTDIGAWYLGLQGTGVSPTSGLTSDGARLLKPSTALMIATLLPVIHGIFGFLHTW